MKLLTLLLLCSAAVHAQTTDPIIMTIDGQPVSRSEFEYSYNKNNGENVVDKKTVAEYVELFINYKLKVAAALEARLDTQTSFKQEFAGYRDQQIRPSFVTDADLEAEARRIYTETQQRIDAQGGMVKPAHILLLLPQKASKEVQRAAEVRIDSIYAALRAGADFATLARRFSDDKGSASNGGELPWIQPGQTLKEFEDAAYALKRGEMSRPFLSPAGYHIVLMKDRRQFVPYDSVRTDILRYIDQRNLREQIIDRKLEALATSTHPQRTPQDVLAQRTEEMAAKDPALRFLIQEYHDGLLLYDISNRLVWEKAAKDEAGLQAFFKKNKKRYAWDAPRFKGIAYYTKTVADLKAVRQTIKRLPFDHWAEALRKTFNNDSTLRIRAEKGLFKQGDNALVDREVFNTGAQPKPLTGYPFSATLGRRLKAPKELDDVRPLVVADYQEELEREWVKALRRQHRVEVNPDVVQTVNQH